MPVIEGSQGTPHLVYLIVQFGTGDDLIHRLWGLLAASVKLGDSVHHGRVPCLRSAVVPNDIGRDAEQPRKCVVIAGVVTLPCSEGRLEHVGE